MTTFELYSPLSYIINILLIHLHKSNVLYPDNSWVGELEWKNGVPKDDKIELDFLDRRSDTDETECYWLITNTWDYGVHTYISIEIKEVL